MFLAVFVDVTSCYEWKDCFDTQFSAYFHRRSYIIRLGKIVKKFVFLSAFIGVATSLGLIRSLTSSRRRPLSYRNQSIDLLRKSMDWFLYDNGLRLESVKEFDFLTIF